LAGFYGVLFVIAIFIHNPKTDRGVSTEVTTTASTNNDKNAKRVTIPSLSNGRVPTDKFLEYLKQEEDLSVDGPPNEIAGTDLAFINDLIGQPCRAYIGGRIRYNQNVSVVIIETIQDKQVVELLLETPLDLKERVGYGNDVNSMDSFVRTILPEAKIREIMGAQSVKLATGGTASADYGKASFQMRYNKDKKNIAIVIAASR